MASVLTAEQSLNIEDPIVKEYFKVLYPIIKEVKPENIEDILDTMDSSLVIKFDFRVKKKLLEKLDCNLDNQESCDDKTFLEMINKKVNELTEDKLKELLEEDSFGVDLMTILLSKKKLNEKALKITEPSPERAAIMAIVKALVFVAVLFVSASLILSPASAIYLSLVFTGSAPISAPMVISMLTGLAGTLLCLDYLKNSLNHIKPSMMDENNKIITNIQHNLILKIPHVLSQEINEKAAEKVQGIERLRFK